MRFPNKNKQWLIGIFVTIGIGVVGWALGHFATAGNASSASQAIATGGSSTAFCTTVPDQEDKDEQQGQPDPPSQTPTAKSPTPTVPLTVADGEQVFRPGTGEVYVVKIVGDERYKRHFLTPEIRDSYGHLKGVDPTRISQEEFDSFTVSCLVKFEEDYYFFDAREDDDQATKHLITDGWRGLAGAGVSTAAVFEVHDLEIDNSAFVPGDDLVASEAARKPCSGL